MLYTMPPPVLAPTALGLSSFLEEAVAEGLGDPPSGLCEVPGEFPGVGPSGVVLIARDIDTSFVPVLCEAEAVVEFTEPDFTPNVPGLVKVGDSA